MNRFDITHIGSYLAYHLLRPHASGYGIHSPFVYRLTRDLLRRKRHCAMTGGTLAERLASWYGCERTVTWNGAPETGCKSVCYAADAASSFPNEARFNDKDVIVLNHIRRDEAAFDNWRQWQQTPGITVTIDLWRSGIIFFDHRLHRQDFTIYTIKARA